MKKTITILTVFITLGLTQDTVPSALLDFSDYTDQEKIDRPIERFVGLNPYNIVGGYTYSWNIGKNESLQRDVDLHLGTTMLIFYGGGINVKQYWYNSKYKAVSYFTSASSSFSVLLGMGGDGDAIDVHCLATGIDFNLMRFNKFDVRTSVGLMAMGSFFWMQGGAMPFVNISLRSGN